MRISVEVSRETLHHFRTNEGGGAEDFAAFHKIELPGVPRVGDDIFIDGVGLRVTVVMWVAGSDDVCVRVK